MEVEFEVDNQSYFVQLEREHSRKLEFNGYSSNRDERSDLLSHIECFEKAIAILSKEKEKLTTDVEKMKTRLRNAMHDIFKLEAEKAYADKELKHLRSQKALL
ncbi:hypothetical protein Rs2_12466 [Raphanus sativus]|nr:hypothetical protein Rs2_12466 [Raphanus sativus]